MRLPHGAPEHLRSYELRNWLQQRYSGWCMYIVHAMPAPTILKSKVDESIRCYKHEDVSRPPAYRYHQMNHHPSIASAIYTDLPPHSKDRPPEQYRPVQQHVARLTNSNCCPKYNHVIPHPKASTRSSQSCQSPQNASKSPRNRLLACITPCQSKAFANSNALAVAAMRAVGRALQ